MALRCLGVLLVLPVLLTAACSQEEQEIQKLEVVLKKLEPLHKVMGEPKPDDWLASRPERGQTFAQYLRCNPVTPAGKRPVIYIQPLGEMDPTRAKIVQLTAEFMGHFFDTKVKVQPTLGLSVVPKSAQRTKWKQKQILTTHVLDEILKPRLPKDAAAFLAFTAVDLWPGEGWNFVFGQASLRERVGVWSINRNGDPTRSKASYLKCLLRTLKTATHETGHMFSMRHCIAYECDMCGSMNRKESDRRPLALCPECVCKVCWASKVDPVARYRKLLAFCKKHGLKEEAEFYAKSIKALKE